MLGSLLPRLRPLKARTPSIALIASHITSSFEPASVTAPSCKFSNSSSSATVSQHQDNTGSTSCIRPTYCSGGNSWGFAASRCFTSSAAPAHDGCGHSHDQDGHKHSAACSHSHGHAVPVDDVTQALQQLADLQQLAQAVQQQPAGAPLTAAHISTALKCAVDLARQQSAASPEAAASAAEQAQQLLALLAPAAEQALPSVGVQQLSDWLMAMTRLGCRSEQLWSSALAAVTPELCSKAGGRELSNVAYAIAATTEANSGSIPGTTREQVEEVLRVVTAQLVSMVQGPGGISQHTHSHDGDCDHSHEQEGGGVTVYHISMVRYAHEVLEGFKAG